MRTLGPGEDLPCGPLEALLTQPATQPRLDLRGEPCTWHRRCERTSPFLPPYRGPDGPSIACRDWTSGRESLSGPAFRPEPLRPPSRPLDGLSPPRISPTVRLMVAATPGHRAPSHRLARARLQPNRGPRHLAEWLFPTPCRA